MNIFKITLTASIFLFFTSCGSDNKSTESAEVVEESTSSVSSPCELVSVADITSMFSVPADINVEMQDKVRTYPTCVFKWNDKTFIETKVIAGTTYKIPMDQEVLIVLVEDAADFMFEGAKKAYKDGVAVDNIGDQAIWGAQISQLTFLRKKTMMHIHVKVSADDAVNKAKAIELANLMLDKL